MPAPMAFVLASSTVSSVWSRIRSCSGPWSEPPSSRDPKGVRAEARGRGPASSLVTATGSSSQVVGLRASRTAGSVAPVSEPTASTPDDGAVPARERLVERGLAVASRWVLRLLVVAAGLVVLGLGIGRLWSIVLPVVLALIVTTVLSPVARLMERWLRFPHALSAAVTLVGSLALVGLLFASLAPSVVDQVGQVATSASVGLEKVEDWVQSTPLDITQEQVETLVAEAQQRLQESAASIAAGVLIGVNAVTSGVITLLLTLVLVFFFLKDGHRFLPWLERQAGPRAGGHLREVGRRSWKVLAGFIRTQALVGLVDAMLIGAGLLIVGVPLALPLAVLTFFGGFVPIVGAVTVGALAVLVALVSNGLTAAIIIFVVILAVQQIEGNVLQPFLQGRSMNLHAAVILLAVTLGSTLFGITGAFLAVPFTAVAAVVYRYVDEQLVAAGGDHPDVGPVEPSDRIEDAEAEDEEEPRAD
ncbi:hypothetical protein LUZ63_020271 [Rhynchospora breviuscula]|uniref:AI-2E family transporter n=1 Tax=Rhynchospora breviuscula TaxID=2022672 RepID=A0A9P9ZA76_9POAL|nr:hypothetical protein LUZ63_020271 [Rhynchospora breviuscula]